MRNITYVLSSCKDWNRKQLEFLRNEHGDNWVWASTPNELNQLVQKYQPRYVFFLHWNWYVPEEIWTRYECICFHMTDVPYGRGGSPLQNLIKAGHKTTKLSALRMEAEMDSGPVYVKRTMSLDGRAEEIYQRASELSIEIIRWIIATNPTPLQQQGEEKLFKRRKPEQSVLPYEGDLKSLYDHIRMLDAPTYPLAYIDHGDFRLKFSHAKICGDEIKATVVLRKRNVDHED